jgi:hypothetical protein
MKFINRNNNKVQFTKKNLMIVSNKNFMTKIKAIKYSLSKKIKKDKKPREMLKTHISKKFIR